MRVTCPDDDVLGQLASGTLEPARRAEVANHAAGCRSCRSLVDALVGTAADTSGPLAITGGAAVPAGGGMAPLIVEVDPDEPRQLGRYLLERRIGAGGMGVVWAARDPELGRRVAVKLLRRGFGAERLRREAMALARLSHPNVVSVYDVGTHDGRSYVAMALVDGDNLRQWLRTPRPQAAIVDALVEAGRGVIAAHDAGLIHRDLKPDNIFVGPRGEVLVGDFGLAREHTSGEDGGGGRELSAADTGLTMAGAVVGTPAYMAPEQADGEAIPASDQFSFCVTAWEALYGARPFQGATSAALRDAIARGVIDDPPAERKVPARIERALRRGLAADPAARFPSMRGLLLALPRPRRRWPSALATVALAGTLIATVVVTRRPLAPVSTPCQGTAQLLAATWSPVHRAALDKALGGAGAPASLVTATLATVDRYAGAWIDLRHDACLATHVRRERRPESLERVARCLDRQAATLGSALATIGRGGLEPVTASAMLGELDPVERCREPDGAAQGAAPSDDAEALRRELAVLELNSRTIDLGLDGVDLPALTARAIALGDPIAATAAFTLEGRVGMLRGQHVAAEAALRRAIAQADTAGDDVGRARAAALLVEELVQTNRLDEARAQLDAAQAALVRAGGDLLVAVDVDEARARLTAARGDHAGAVAARQAALDHLRAVRGDDSATVAIAYYALGIAHVGAGAPAAARTAVEAATAIEARLHRVVDGPKAVEAAIARAHRALFAGELAQAVAETERAVALAHLYGPGTATEAMTMAQLAGAQEIAGDQPAAARSYAGAIAVADAIRSGFPDRLVVLGWMINAGVCHHGAGQPAEARAWAQRAIARADEIGTGAGPHRKAARAGLGRALVSLGRHEEALPLLRQALDDTAGEASPRPFTQGWVAFALARALWETGGDRDRDRARALARDAEQKLDAALAEARGSPVYAGLALRIGAERAAVVAWRHAHP